MPNIQYDVSFTTTFDYYDYCITFQTFCDRLTIITTFTIRYLTVKQLLQTIFTLSYIYLFVTPSKRQTN